MEIKRLMIPLDDDRIASLLFRRVNDGNDWVCVMNDEFMTDLSDLLEVEEHTLQ
jgi:hypothetical protein